MSATAHIYGSFVSALNKKEVNLLTDDIRVALVGANYTPNQDTHDYWDDVVANEASGTGYTAGGLALASKSFTYDNATNTWKFTAADSEWDNSTISARFAVLYNRTPASNATRPLIAYIDFGALRSSTEGLFRLAWHTNGIFTVTV